MRVDGGWDGDTDDCVIQISMRGRTVPTIARLTLAGLSSFVAYAECLLSIPLAYRILFCFSQLSMFNSLVSACVPNVFGIDF